MQKYQMLHFNDAQRETPFLNGNFSNILIIFGGAKVNKIEINHISVAIATMKED